MQQQSNLKPDTSANDEMASIGASVQHIRIKPGKPLAEQPEIGLTAGTRIFLSSRACALVMKLRSEEHTSELQSRENLVCRLLLEKKKQNKKKQKYTNTTAKT